MSLEHDIAIQLQRLQSTGFDAKLKAQADASSPLTKSSGADSI